MNQVRNILVIEDNPTDLLILEELIEISPIQHARIDHLTRLKDLENWEGASPDIIFLDLNLPDSNGLETFLRVNEVMTEVPIIILSGLFDTDIALQGIQAGAQDFLVKGEFDERSLVKAMQYGIERKRTELKLKESEEQYRTLVEYAPDTVVVFDIKSGRFVNVSHSAEKMFKMSKEELLKRGPADLSPLYQPDGRRSDESAMEKLQQALEGRIPQFEWTHLDANGDPILCEISLVRIPSKDTMLVRGSITDISIRKKAEEAIRAAEETRKLIMNSALDAIVCMDFTGRIILWTPQAEKIFGWSQDEILGKKVAETIIPEYLRAEHEIGFQRSKIMGENSPGLNRLMETIAQHKSGFTFPVELTIALVDKGENKFFCAFIRDIIERVKAREELQQSEDRYRTVVEQASDAIMITDDNGHFLEVNSTFCKIFGYTTEELIGRDVRTIIDPLQLEKDPLRFDILKSDTVYHRERRMMNRDGNIIEVEVSIKRIPDGRVIAIARDITARKMAENALRESRENFISLVNTIDGIVWEADARTLEVSFISSQAERMLGYPVARWLNEPGFWAEHILEEDRAWSQQRSNELIQLKKPFELEYRMVASDGRILWLRDFINVILENDQPAKLRGIMVDVTERRKAELALNESEKNLRHVLASTGDDFYVIDKNYRVVMINHMASVNLKRAWNVNVGTGDVITNLLPPEMSARLIRNYERVFKGERIEYEIQHPERLNRNWVQVTLSPVSDEKGDITGAYVVTKDITDKREAENALKRSEEKYRSLVEQAADAICIFDAEGNFHDVNSSAVRLLRYPKEELISLNLADVFFPKDIRDMPVQYEVLDRGESTIRQRSLRRKDGSAVITEVHTTRMSDGRYLAVVRDMTDRISAQKLVEKEKKLADTIISSLPGLFYLFDSSGTYIRWNKLKEEISGYSHDEISRMSPLDFFKGQEREKVRKHIEHGLAYGETTVEACLTTRDGREIPFYFTGVSLEYEGRLCLLGTGIDISDRKTAEDLLKQTTEQLRQLSTHLQNVREEERMEIAREIHDELGQQLTVLKMDISWLKKRVDISEPKIEHKMNELMEVVDNTVRTVRKISSDLRPSMLDDLGLIPALEWHSQEFEKRSGIRTNFETETSDFKLPATVATAMFRIFQESLTNVARHAEASEVNATLKFEKGNLLMRIRDNGKGFSMSGIGHKRTLGILGMRERVSIIKGEYKIDSSPGSGTTVEVRIPVNEN